MPTAAALFQGGKIAPIAVSSPAREAATPEVPTFGELGLPKLTVQSWWGLMAPAGTPKPVLDKLERAMATVMQSAPVKQRLGSVGVEPPADPSAQALTRLLAADFDRWHDVVKRAGIKFE
ncbi:Tripartite tricarboxylate transporter family receptor [compost metagenome]